jgi:hypothetical protein
MNSINQSLQASLAFLFCCFGIWLFADSLWYIDDQRELLTNQIMDETILKVGIKEPCIAEISLSAFEDMNTLGIYQWVVACEKANEGN